MRWFQYLFIWGQYSLFCFFFLCWFFYVLLLCVESVCVRWPRFLEEGKSLIHVLNVLILTQRRIITEFLWEVTRNSHRFGKTEDRLISQNYWLYCTSFWSSMNESGLWNAGIFFYRVPLSFIHCPIFLRLLFVDAWWLVL